jgi:predicted dehydrogenase
VTRPATTAAPVTIALIGHGAESERWARALRGVEGVVAEQRGAGDTALMEALSDETVAAVAFAGQGGGDLAASIKRALMANRHVLAAVPTAISSRQLLALEARARRRGRVLVFDTGAFADERIAFVRKMIAGPHALWRPRYLRALRCATDERTLDEQAIAEIACVVGMLDATPDRVSAVSPRYADETSAPDAAMITLVFESGVVGRIDVSLVEPEPRQEIAIACDGRTIVLDAHNARAPFQIQAAARHQGPRAGMWGETVSEHPAVDLLDRLSRAASAFVAAVRARDLAVSNGRALADAAAVWEAARRSIGAGGEVVDVHERPAERRPALQLIVGGGHPGGARPAPDLRLVPPTSSGRDRPDPPEPLRSA